MDAKVLVMDSHRMYLPPPVEGKPGSQDSSLDTDLTEDVFFNTSWQESVGGAQRNKSTSSGVTTDMDFNAVKSETQVLDSEAAKHKISIKPRSRRASSQRNRTKPSGGASALPQLKEESPPKEIPSEGVTIATPKPNEDVKPVDTKPTKEEVKVTDVEDKVKDVETEAAVTKPTEQEPLIIVKDNKTSIQIVGKDKPEARTVSPSLEVDTETASKRRSMTESEKDKMPGLPVSPVALGAVKLRTRPRPKSLIEPPQLPQPSGDELAKAFNKRLSVRKERSSEGFSEEDFFEVKKDSNEITPAVLPSDLKKTPPTGAAPSTGGITYVLKKEPLRKTSSSDSAKTSPLKAVSEDPNKNDQPKTKPTDTKAEPVKIEVPKKDSVPPSVQEKSKSLTNKLASPREEYRLKRQSRSKTLPVQPVSQEFLDKRINDNTAAASNLSQSVKEETTETKADILSPGLSKKSEPKRLSLKETNNAASEPSWFALARRKQADAEKEEKEAAKKENSPPVGAKVNPLPSSGGAKTTPLQSSIGAKTTPLQSSIGPKPTPAQSSVGPKPTPGQSSVGTKTNPPTGINTSSASKEGSASVRSFRDKMADKSESAPFNKASVKSSGFSSKEEKEKINGNKKAPETKKEAEPVQRTLSNRSKFEAKSSTTGVGSQASTSSSSSSSVPAWKANLAKKKEKEPQIKIEIIEKKTEKPVPPKKPSKALEEKVLLREKPVVDKCSDKRQSKVLDMVKSFQKLEVS